MKYLGCLVFFLAANLLAQEFVVKSYPVPREVFWPTFGISTPEANDPFGYGADPFGGGAINTNKPPDAASEAIDLGGEVLVFLNRLGAEIPAGSAAVSFEQSLQIRTSEAAHERLGKILRDACGAKANLLVEVNCSFVAFDLALIQNHPEFAERGSLSQGALLKLWSDGKGTLLAQEKCIGISSQNQRADGRKEMIFPTKLRRASRPPLGGPLPAFTPGSFDTREVGLVFNVTPSIPPGINPVQLALGPEFSKLAPHPGHFIPGENQKRMDVALPFIHTYVSTSLILAAGGTVVQGGGLLPADENTPPRLAYAIIGVDLLDRTGQRIPAEELAPPGPVTNETGFVTERILSTLPHTINNPEPILEALGMPFPEGASATNMPDGVLQVINLPENMKFLEAVRPVESSQVEIDASLIRFPIAALRSDAEFMRRGAASSNGLMRLLKAGHGTLLRTQKIITISNVEAQGAGTVEIAYPETANATNVFFETRDMGMVLNVKPFVSGNQIRIQVDLQATDLDGWTEPGDGRRLPVFHSQNWTGNLIVESGGTVVVGGNMAPGPNQDAVEVFVLRAELSGPNGAPVTPDK